MLIIFWIVGSSCLLVFLIRCYSYRHSRPVCSKIAQCQRRTFKLCAIAGSGGHTAELLTLMKTFGERYTPRIYIVANSDHHSAIKIAEFEKTRMNANFKIEKVSRSREVGQSYISSVFTTLMSLLDSFRVVSTNRPDVILCNGPGTCIPICFVAAIFDLFLLLDIRIFFVESICRVEKLSLSGLILYYTRIPDAFFVYWSSLLQRYPRVLLIPSGR